MTYKLVKKGDYRVIEGLECDCPFLGIEPDTTLYAVTVRCQQGASLVDAIRASLREVAAWAGLRPGDVVECDETGVHVLGVS